MTTDNVSHPDLTALEDALVGEFRAYQVLMDYTREERRLLTLSDLPALMTLLERKETLLGELARLDHARRTSLDHWAQSTAHPLAQTLTDILPHLEPPTAERMRRLREGILALVAELREMAPGNRALAQTALEHVEAVRNFLLSLNQPAVGYQSYGKPSAVSQSSLITEQWV